MNHRQQTSRRSFVAAAAAAGVGAVAGCLGGLSEAGQTSFADNPVARDVDDRPRLGPPHSETELTIVTYSDPSCPSCATYHENGFQAVQSNWVEDGRATVYERVFPYVAPWGENAIHGLAEVYRRDPPSFWELKDSYYANYDALSEDSVVEETRSYVAELDVDTDAVVEAVREKPNEAYVSADVDTGEEAGIDGVPTTFLFSEGEFVTTLGSEGFDAFELAVESHD